MRAPVLIRASAPALLLVLTVASVANLLRAAQAVTVFDLSPMTELRALARLAPHDQALHVRDESGTALLWVTFFLQDRPLYLGNYSPYYLHGRWPFYQDSITAPLVLVNREAARSSPWDAGTVYENDRYRVARKDPAIFAHLDFSRAPRALEPDRELRVTFLLDRTVVDGQPFRPALAISEGRTVVLGLWAAGAAFVRLIDGGGERVLHVSGDRDPVSWAGASPPAEIVLANVGAQTVLVPGWLAVAHGASWPTSRKAPDGPLAILRDEVLPGSGLFAVSGWHGPEGSVRWSRAYATAVFRNPGQKSALRIDCILWRPGLVAVTKVALLVNGRFIGRLACSGTASEVFSLPETLLGGRSWGLLEIRVDPVFVPKVAGVSADERDLGVLVRGLRLEPGG